MNKLALFTITMIAGLLVGSFARGAEIQFRRDCRPTSGLITLGDIAEVRCADPAVAEELAAIEICPAPAPGKKRILGAAELRQCLARRGVNLAQCRLGGASEVSIVSAAPAAPVESARTNGQDMAARRRVEQGVRGALARYLQEKGVGGDRLDFRIELPDEGDWETLATIKQWRVSGGAEPWDGEQVFTVEGQTAEAPMSFEVRATIEVPDSVVVAATTIARGAIIQESDLAIAPLQANEAGEKYFYRVEDVVGHEATQAIAQGRAVVQRAVRQPLLIKRGEIVTVLARSSGITVETNGRAKSDGALGEVIAVESMANKQSYFARVSGLQRVEIYAKATRPAAPPVAAQLPRPPIEAEPAPAIAAPIAEPPVEAAPPVLAAPTDEWTGSDRVARRAPRVEPTPQQPAPAAPVHVTPTPAQEPQPVASAPADDSTLRWVKRRAR